MDNTSGDKKDFLAIMLGLADNFPNTELTKAGLAMRFDVLKSYSLDEVRNAAHRIMLTRKFSTFPTIAEFKEHLDGGSPEDAAMIEATKVLAAVKAEGGYISIVFDDPITMAVVDHYFGGWPQLCENIKVAEEKWFLKDFSQVYGAFARQKIELFGKLPGRVELSNRALVGDVTEYHRTVFVGDEQRARNVLAQGEAGKELGPGIARNLLALKNVGEKVRED